MVRRACCETQNVMCVVGHFAYTTPNNTESAHEAPNHEEYRRNMCITRASHNIMYNARAGDGPHEVLQLTCDPPPHDDPQHTRILIRLIPSTTLMCV